MDTRFRRRTWNRKKSHLPKHSSLAELQLLPPGRPLFHCQRCGFINTLIPLCLWCTWTSQEAEHAFELSMPRARRISAPAKIHLDLSTSDQPPHGRAASLTPARSPKKWRASCFLENAEPTRCAAPETKTDLDISLPGDEAPETKQGHMIEATRPIPPTADISQEESDPRFAASTSGGIPIATSSLQSSLDGKRGLEVEVDSRSPTTTVRTILSKSDLRDPLLESSPQLPGEHTIQFPQGVDRTHSGPTMATPKSNRMLKSSRRVLIIDFHDNKAPISADDADDEQRTTFPNSDGQRAPSPIANRHHHLPTLRRKKNLNIRTSDSDANVTEPISISLTLRTSPSKGILRKSSQPQFSSPPASSPRASNSHSRHLSHIISLGSESGESQTSATPPKKPILTLITSPVVVSGSPPSSSPVRIGHPSRPYYSAIRGTNGISPPSRPSSTIGSPPLRSRPQSYTPPSGVQQSSSEPGVPSSGISASRHLSMSFVSSAYGASSSPGMFSAFSVLDDTDEDDDSLLPTLPPTPAPTRFSFSLTGRGDSSHRHHRVSFGSVKPSHASANAHTYSQSLSHARGKGYRGSGGMGFSMSGETELRMALAAGAASAGIVEDGFRFRETAAAPMSAPATDVATTENGRRSRSKTLDDAEDSNPSGFLNRVRKLRKGLKEMLFMTSTTTTA